MRYLVTGAAGFIGSHLAEALRRRGARRRRRRLLHRLLRPGAEGGERPRARRASRPTSRARLESILDGVDGVFHLAGPARRARELRRRLRALRRPERARDAAAVRGGGRGTACASSSPPRRRSTATPSATRRPRTSPPRPISPYGDHEARAASTSPTRTPGASGSTPSCCATSRVYGPRQRPDMAFTPHARRRSRTAATVPPLRRRLQPRELHLRRRRRRRDDRGDGARPGGDVYNVGGGEEATMTRGDRARRGGSPAGRSRDRAARPRQPATCGARAPTSLRPSGARLGADDRAARTGCAAQWEWAAARVAAR